MGVLIIANGKSINSGSSTASKSYTKNNYSNDDAVENLIRYITRTRIPEKRLTDLICYGAVGAIENLGIESIISKFLDVQNYFRINSRKGPRMHHEIFDMYLWETANYNLTPLDLYNFASECASVYFNEGFQIVFAVHQDQDGSYHVHFAINAVSYVDGHKYHVSFEDTAKKQFDFNQILNRYQNPGREDASHPICFHWTPKSNKKER